MSFLDACRYSRQDDDTILADLNAWSASLSAEERASWLVNAPKPDVRSQRRARRTKIPHVYVNSDGDLTISVDSRAAIVNSSSVPEHTAPSDSMRPQFWDSFCDTTVVTTTPTFPGSMNTIAIVGGRGGQFCSDTAEGVVCNRQRQGPWEIFHTQRIDAHFTGLVRLTSRREDPWNVWCADEFTNGVNCNRRTPGDWERFVFYKVRCGPRSSWRDIGWAIAGLNRGQFCSDDIGGRLRCNRNTVRNWEVHRIAAFTGVNWVWV